MALTPLLMGRFRLLDAGRDVTPPGEVQRHLLAALLLVGRGVLTEQQLLEVARSAPTLPGSGQDAARTVAEALAGLGTARLVTRSGSGWTQEFLSFASSDAARLRSRTDLARARLRTGDDGGAVDALEPMLGLAVGRPLDGLTGSWFEPHRARLHDVVVDAWTVYAEALSRQPTPEAVDRLRDATRRFPAVAELWLRRMTTEAAVHGRRDALAVYAEAQLALGTAFAGPDGTPLRQARAAIGRGTTLPESRVSSTESRPANRFRARGTAVVSRMSLRRRSPLTDADRPGIRYEVLRGTKVFVDDHRLRFVPPECLPLLTVLLLARGTPVPTDELLTAAASPLPDARAVRGVLARFVAHARSARGDAVVTRARGGWRLVVEADALDLAVAERLAAEGWDAVASRPERAAGLLQRAADAVPDDPFPSLRSAWAQQRRADVLRWRRATLAAATTARDRSVDDRRSVTAARAAVLAEPLREDLWETYLLAVLWADGEAAALAAYAEAAEAIESRLRTGPGPSLRMLRARIEAGDPGLRQP